MMRRARAARQKMWVTASNRDLLNVSQVRHSVFFTRLRLDTRNTALIFQGAAVFILALIFASHRGEKGIRTRSEVRALLTSGEY